MNDVHVYRVTARGRFKNLTSHARSQLEKAKSEHDIFLSAYTAEGTFTYDEKILFFNLRYEVRTSEGSEVASQIGRKEAEQFLDTLGYSFHPLKITVVDTSAMWVE